MLDDRHWQIPDFEVQEFKTRQRDYCVCIPVINEGQRIRRELTEMSSCHISESADILILDGGSTDGSLEETFLESNNVRTLLIKKGPGKLSAQLRMGYAYALRQDYQGIVTVDGNNKDGVAVIPDFIRTLQQGYDFVQGSRFVHGGSHINTPRSRLLAIRLLHAPLTSLASGFLYSDTTNGFRGYSRKLLLDARLQPFRDIFTTYELLPYISIRTPRLRGKVIEIPVTRRYPASGSIPTKISGHQMHIKLLLILLKAALGIYDP